MAGYCLHNVPPDIYKFLMNELNKNKLSRGTNKFSIETSLYILLREHPKFIEFKKKLEQDEFKSLHHDI